MRQIDKFYRLSLIFSFASIKESKFPQKKGAKRFLQYFCCNFSPENKSIGREEYLKKLMDVVMKVVKMDRYKVSFDTPFLSGKVPQCSI